VYIDSRAEALKVFQTNVAGTLEVIARDVKVQVAFDPRVVTRYRLLGYENRAVADADFRNDDVDGGEIGAGHSVTALYELELAEGATAGNLGTVAVRGQRAGGVGPRAFETEAAITREALAPTLAKASTELRFAAAVAGAADVLRGNGAVSAFTLEAAIGLARGASRELPEREEFVKLMETAQRLQSSVVAGR
jgi:Ca-activated chloride channel family protein